MFSRPRNKTWRPWLGSIKNHQHSEILVTLSGAWDKVRSCAIRCLSAHLWFLTLPLQEGASLSCSWPRDHSRQEWPHYFLHLKHALSGVASEIQALADKAPNFCSQDWVAALTHCLEICLQSFPEPFLFLQCMYGRTLCRLNVEGWICIRMRKPEGNPLSVKPRNAVHLL